MHYDQTGDVGNWRILETLRMARKRTWMERFNNLFWRLLGV